MSLPETTTAPPDDEPIVATIVPRAASPWQFGLKSLLGLMVVCGVQFALMRYLTVFGGLLTAVGLCFAALAVLLVWAVAFVRSGSTLMERLDFVGIRLVVGIAILLVGTILAGGGTAVAHVVGNAWNAMELEQDLGIRTVRTQVWDGNTTSHALKIVLVVPGSHANKVGLTSGEVIVLSETIDEFYQRLQQKRGQTDTLTIVTNPVAGSITNLPKRQVTIVIPK